MSDEALLQLKFRFSLSIDAKETLNLKIINNVMEKYMIARRIRYDNKQW